MRHPRPEFSVERRAGGSAPLTGFGGVTKIAARRRRMFEQVVPELKIGWLQPSSVVDVAAYEFYKLAPPRVMLVLLPLGRGEFSDDDAERDLAALDDQIDQLIARGVHMIVQSGVPAPLLLGIEAHDRMIEHIARRSGLPATSTVLCVVRAAANLSIRKLGMATIWAESINKTLAQFFARGGVEVCGSASQPMQFADFRKLTAVEQLTLAYELGRRAFLENPNCDGVYLGGGSWPAEPVVLELEKEFARPVISHRAAMVRHSLQLLSAWRPIADHGRVLAEP
jgi:maleate isomerase